MKLVIERGRVVPFEELPPRSLALDGYVQGPELDLVGQRFSFDHHDRCVRLLTRATCQQIMDALLLGFDPEGYTVYLNDVDGDTALSVWLLRNRARVEERAVRMLVESVGGMDAHGPAYPPLDPEVVEGFFARAMEPEQRARGAGEYPTCDLGELLEACVAGIGDFVAGGMQGAEERPSVPYEVFRRGTGGWVLVEAEGFVFRDLYRDGYTRVISHRRLPDGSFAYSVARKSDLVTGFPVGPASRPGTILHALAAREPGWGGGTSIGGSPRHEDGSSSKLGPEEVFEVVEGVVSDDSDA